MRWITTTFVFLGLLLAIAGVARAGQEEQFTPEFKEAHTSYDAKHTPKLSAPDSVKRGQWFEVTVTVGAGGGHPALCEHPIPYIAVYKDTAEIGRVYLQPAFSAPRVALSRALDG